MTGCGQTFLSGLRLPSTPLRELRRALRRAASAAALAGIAGLAFAQTPSAQTEAFPGQSAAAPSATSVGQPSSAPAGALINTSADQPLSASADSSRTPADTVRKSKNELADTVRYEAAYIEYDNEERVLTLIGGARVRYQNITLQADTIIYTVADDRFQARGGPQLAEGTDTTVGDLMTYNIKTRRGRVSYAFTRFNDTYVTGGNIVKTRDNNLYIEQGDYTTCENPRHPHYYFYGRHILVIPDDKVVGRPVVMNIGDAPVAVLPYFAMPLRRGRRSGWLTPSWGGSVARGGYVDNVGYYYAQSDYFDATLSAKAQEFNSFVLNARGRYNLRYTLDGEASGRYVIDNRLENSSRQWALDYRHNQLLSPDGRTRLSGYGSIVSSSDFNQLYSDRTYELEKQQLDANMSLSHRFDAVNASTNLVWRRNHNLTTDKTVEDMPSLDFRLQNRTLLPYKAGGSKSGPSWYNNIFYAYDAKANVRREAYGSDSVKGFIRPGMENNANVTSSQKILKYLDISPYVNMRASMFYGAIDTLSKDTLDTEFNLVKSWNAGANLSTRIYGLFPVNAFGITAIRHTLTPTVGYSFTPKHELDRTFYKVGINYAGPRTKAEQLMTFSLSNSFQGKRTAAAKKGGGGNVNTVNSNADGVLSGINNGDGVSGGDAANGGIDNRVINDGGIDTVDAVNADNRVDNDGGIDTVDTNNSVDNDRGISINDSETVIERSRNDRAPDNKNNAAGADSADAAKKESEKDKNVKREEKFDILTVSLSTAYNFEADERRWQNLSLSASTGISIFNVSFSSSFWFYDEAGVPAPPIINSYRLDLTSGRLGASGYFWDGDLFELGMAKAGDEKDAARGGGQSWNIGFSPSLSYIASRSAPSELFVPRKSFNVSSSANLNVTKSLSVAWNGNYDFSSDRFSHNSFNFYYDMECWEMRFSWRPEKINPGFSFVVNIKKIPDIKWEQNDNRSTRVL